jgi:hypothetical protein
MNTEAVREGLVNITQRGYAIVGAALLVVVFAFGAYAYSVATGEAAESPAATTSSLATATSSSGTVAPATTTPSAAATGRFEHSDISALLGSWSPVGENIAYGYSVQSMFNGPVGSQGHYDNMVNEAYTHVGVGVGVGVGVWVDPDARIWTTHVFGG